MKKILILFFCINILGAFAQKTFTPEDLWKLGMVSDPQVSPDGKTVLFTIKYTNLAENKGSSDVYALTTEGKGFIKIIEQPGNEFNIRWRPDGKKIGFLMADGGAPQVYEVNPDGSGLEKISAEAGGIEGFEYSPTLDKILFHKSVNLQMPDTKLFKDLPKASGKVFDGLMYRHWTEWADGSFNHVFVQNYSNGELIGSATDLMKGEWFDCPVKPMGGIEQITWRPDGKAIVYTCKKKTGTADATSTNTDLYLYETETQKTTNLTEGMMGYDVEPRFSPDGKWMAWQSMARDGYEADKNRLMIREMATGKITDATQNYDLTIQSLVWSRLGGKVYFEVLTQGTVQYYEWDSKKPLAQSIQAVTSGMANFTSISCFQKGKTEFLIGTRQSMKGPNELWIVDPVKKTETQLSHVNTEFLAEFKPSKIEKRMVKATDGKEILTWVVYPADFDPMKQYPAVLFCQGGPQSMVGQSFSLRWNFQLMAQQGYIMVLPNRRGLPGFGQEWNESISGKWGEQAMADLISVTDDLSKEPYVDKNRWAAVGASFGGYSVYWLAGHHQKRFKAFIAHCGVFNLESMYGATEEIWFSNWDMKGPYWQEPQPESYTRFSPHKFVKKWDTPMLVIHNEKDFRVPLTEGLQAFSAAQLQNIPSRFLYFPDEGHWVLKPQNSVLWNRVFFDWLDRYLKK